MSVRIVKFAPGIRLATLINAQYESTECDLCVWRYWIFFGDCSSLWSDIAVTKLYKLNMSQVFIWQLLHCVCVWQGEEGPPSLEYIKAKDLFPQKELVKEDESLQVRWIVLIISPSKTTAVDPISICPDTKPTCLRSQDNFQIWPHVGACAELEGCSETPRRIRPEARGTNSCRPSAMFHFICVEYGKEIICQFGG